MKRHLEDIGVKGQFMSFYQSGNPKYRKPRIKHVNRFVYERDNNSYYNSKHVRILRNTLEETINEISTNR